MTEAELTKLIKDHIGDFPDFPQKGILFKDLFTALQHGEVCKAVKTLLVDHIKNTTPNVDAVVGLEARGFLFSLLIAAELGIACVPIRKKGKLPGDCLQFNYKLEYGSDTFEMQKNSITPGQKVVIVDDLLATGGTMNAAVELVKQSGGDVIECVVIMELLELKGKDKVEAAVHSFIKY